MSSENTPPPEAGGAEGGGTHANEEEVAKLEAESEKLAQEMTATCDKELKKRMSVMEENLQSQLQSNFDNQMRDVGQRFTTQVSHKTKHRQTDLLRVNKVFRDVARYLGADWKPVYLMLMAAEGKREPDLVTELQLIEDQRSFMQPYKALNLWRDSAEEFSITPLVDALRTCGKYELADRTMDILESEGDGLMSMDEVGKGIAKVSAELETMNAADKPNGVEDGAHPLARAKKTLGVSEAPATGPLEDRTLLKMSKQLDKEWMSLGKVLGISDENLEEIKELEGAHTYQAAFKLLWMWRDVVGDTQTGQQSAATLAGALEKIGRADLAQNLQSASSS